VAIGFSGKGASLRFIKIKLLNRITSNERVMQEEESFFINEKSIFQKEKMCSKNNQLKKCSVKFISFETTSRPNDRTTLILSIIGGFFS
jgi:hypothetical protein